MHIDKLASMSRYLAIATFFSFVLGAMFLGGNAFNGHEEDGRFYLSLRGTLTEVSDAVFLYSRIHGFVLLGSFALAAVLSLASKPEKREMLVQRNIVVICMVVTGIIGLVRRL